MKLFLHLIPAVIFFSLSFPVFGAEPIVINEALESRPIGQHLEYIEDKEKRLTIEDMDNASLQWTPIKKEKVGLSYSSSVYWFRFVIDNQSQEGRIWYLEIGNSRFEIVDLYVPEGRGKHRTIATGTSHDFSARDVFDRNFVFRIHGKTKGTYYLRIYSTNPIKFPINIMSDTAYFEKNNKELPLLWFFYGIMLVMALYNIIIYISIKDMSYIYLTFRTKKFDFF